jgi:hypothetical protein
MVLYRDIWAGPFSGSKPVLDAWGIRENFGRRAKGRNHRVCFRELAINIYGPAAPITVASWNTPCSDTALVRAYADFVIRGMNLQVGLLCYPGCTLQVFVISVADVYSLR